MWPNNTFPLSPPHTHIVMNRCNFLRNLSPFLVADNYLPHSPNQVNLNFTSSEKVKLCAVRLQIDSFVLSSCRSFAPETTKGPYPSSKQRVQQQHGIARRGVVLGRHLKASPYDLNDNSINNEFIGQCLVMKISWFPV